MLFGTHSSRSYVQVDWTCKLADLDEAATAADACVRLTEFCGYRDRLVRRDGGFLWISYVNSSRNTTAT
jgi:hypothetical protein